MTSISKNLYIDKLDDVVNKYNNTYHSTIKMKSFEVNSSTYIDFDKQDSKEHPKFKVVDHVRISGSCKSIFVHDYVPNLSEKVFLITKVKNTIS